MRKNNCFVLRNIFNKKVLVPVKKNEVGTEPILLNDVGAEIWLSADNAKNFEDLLDIITVKYQLGKNSAEQVAVSNFISNLIDMKLIYEV